MSVQEVVIFYLQVFIYFIYTQIISTTLRGYHLLIEYYVIVVSRGSISTGIDLFNSHILQRLRDQFIQQWNSDIDNSPESINFRMFKLNFERENYLNQSTSNTMDSAL